MWVMNGGRGGGWSQISNGDRALAMATTLPWCWADARMAVPSGDALSFGTLNEHELALLLDWDTLGQKEQIRADPEADQEEQRRVRHREWKRQARQRQKNELESMRRSVAHLEANYQHMAKAFMASYKMTMMEPATLNESTRRILLRRRQCYLLAQEIEQLRRERVYLTDRLTYYQQVSRCLDSCLDQLRTDLQRQAQSMELTSGSLLAHMPLDHALLLRIVAESYEQIVESHRNRRFLHEPSHAFGWQVKRAIEDTTLHFQFHKCLPSLDVPTLMERTWDILIDPRRVQHLQAANQLLEVVHVVNDDVVLLRRRMDHTSLQQVIWATILQFRIRTDTGGFIVNRTLPSHLGLVDDIPHSSGAPAMDDFQRESTVELFQWFHFEGQPNQTAATFGGFLDNHSRPYASFFLAEIVCCVVRWENAIKGRALPFQ